ncbi:MAG: 4Fe-4S dicluster domain-containing protein [Lachnospiraceae bacterium]|nr:4Fe-4S dicluster domain-containing protein [Lachnospiraceae bacterium]
MSKKWYPVIDYVICAECGACVNKCTHGVYDAKKDPTPIVIKEKGCIEGCHGCGNLCPNGAITYVGDDTGWVPPNGANNDNESCSCSGDCC